MYNIIYIYNRYIFLIVYFKHGNKNIKFFMPSIIIFHRLTVTNWSDVRDFDLVRITRAHLCTLGAICTSLRPFSIPFCFPYILNTYNNSNILLIIIIRMHRLYSTYSMYIHIHMRYCNEHMQGGII